MPDRSANAPLSRESLEQTFGRLIYTVNSDRTINLSESWVARNITTVYVPQLDGVPTYGGTLGGRVRWHVKGVQRLLRVFAAVEAAGVLGDILFYDGSFFPRLMRGSKSPSRHSWGTALDLNARWNGFRETPAALGETGTLLRVAPIFRAHGFSCGAYWNSPDGMHFEINETQDDEPSLPPVFAPLAARVVIDDDPKRVLTCSIAEGRLYAPHGELAALTGQSGPERPEREILVAEYLRSLGYYLAWNGEQKKLYAYSPPA